MSTVTKPLLLNETGIQIVEALQSTDIVRKRVEEINKAAQETLQKLTDSLPPDYNELLERLPQIDEGSEQYYLLDINDIDKTLMHENMAADAKATGDRAILIENDVNALKNTIDEVEDFVMQKTPIATSLNSFASFEKRYECSAGVRISPAPIGLKLMRVPGYTTYTMVAEKKYSLYFDSPTARYISLVCGRNYTGMEQLSDDPNDAVLVSSDPIRFLLSNNELPTRENPLVVNAGDVFVVTIPGDQNERIYGLEFDVATGKGIKNDVKDICVETIGDTLFSSVNLFDAKLVENGYYFTSAGEIRPVSDGSCDIIRKYIPIERGKTYSWNYLYGLLICTYDSEKNFIERLTPYTPNSYTSKVFSDDVAYVRLCTYNVLFPDSFVFTNADTTAKTNIIDTKYIPVLLSKGMKAAWFGDSISQLKNLPRRVGDLLQTEVYDCSFAGGVMCSHSNERYRKIGFAEIVNSIVSGDFSAQEQAITDIETGDGVARTKMRENLATLSSLNFDAINTVIVLYGTNDWGNNNTSISNFKTMMTDAVSKFLTAYPHIQMYFISPIWRGNGENSLSTIGTLYDVVTAEREVCESFNIPFYDLYRNCGINEQTKGFYLESDELHQTEAGDEMLAVKCAKFIYSN